MSLRSLLTSIAGILLVLASLIAAALMVITSRMEQNNVQLWQAVESVRAVEQLEIALLLHNREQRMLALTGDPKHAEAMQEAEEELHYWLKQSRAFVGSPAETVIVNEVTASVELYLRRSAEHQSTPGRLLSDGPQLITHALENSEKLIEVNFADARAVADETDRWDGLANLLGLSLTAAMAIGLGAGLWSVRRSLYQPLLSIRDALVNFRPGKAQEVAPEVGPQELREIAHEFNQMAERLQRQREVQLSFVAGVAHDLRNPLSALKLGVSTMRPHQPLPPEDKLRERFVLITRQVERLERMVEDLLDTARIEAGRLELRLESQDLRGLVHEAVALHQGLSPAHELVAELPEAPVSVRCDPTRISQVLNNLLSNAIKYSPEGGQVRVALDTTAGEARVAVRDSGVGIPSSERESIFEPFRRSTRNRDTIPGVGLGLSVARRIIEAHGGHIAVESTPGVGSTFHFRLPLP
ncbi:HAMP domain-containing sensor histidine kinase [Stigmatella erecta]|uniref:histidine kinase n=1 Tax=Stigmatella erecta TaxID=83460 RepID=A0A1I0LGL1_9BACT|nr:HAMP domain-containing sensor histidine kinase [Stigmatella erecta]SEU38941.1 HAMP domain-containing protein [Stigmatella erecta]